ncbi:YkvA family protein [Lutibacter sp.]|uniref:YkvA family protein n=1 Tax=Lutibacter sp. TaxID=1925666 RepID=UPI001A2EBEBD|nr:YkvA family protein [Lutibacter sp.]MBI9041958.1 DUF1232 domain-containing protein [Lutibacter sp.]
MNEKQKKDAKEKFKQYQNVTLTPEDMEKAQIKADKLGDQMNNFKLLLEMVKDHWNGNFKINAASFTIIIGAIVYVISPLDAIPDMIPVLGWIDDVSILAFAMTKIQSVLNEYRVYKEKGNLK